MAGSTYFSLDAREFERLEKAIQKFEGDAEKTINSVLHNEGRLLIQEEIKRLMPVSGKHWKGKKQAAKTGNSLTDEKGNLFITIKTTKPYQYLYFPDDGTTTRRHVGDQQFFLQGGEAKQTEIIDLCVKRLVGDLENLT